VPALTVDVVVPTRDTREVTLRCLEALEEAAEPDIEVHRILVDNASSDGTAAAAERLSGVQVVRNDRNLGFGTAVNLGARVGDGNYVLILNSDVFARAGAVTRLARYLEQHRDVAAAAGRLVHEGTDLPQVGFAIRAFPTLGGQLALLVGLERYWPGNPVSRRQAMRSFDYGRTQEVYGQPAGACFMCRRTDFEAIGGFDEGFFYWFEDVDLVRRLRARGGIAYVHDAVFEHSGGATFRSWSRAEVIVSRYQGLLRYFRKYHSAREVVVLRTVIATLALFRALPLAFVDRPRARAYAQVFRLTLD
jgi:GT2 family glycosyltransferase